MPHRRGFSTQLVRTVDEFFFLPCKEAPPPFFDKPNTHNLGKSLHEAIILFPLLLTIYIYKLFMLRTFLCQKRLYSTPSYFVSRTSSKGLPVYSEYKNGRTNLSTIVRRIKGDANALVNDLKKDFPEAVAEVNPITQNVIIKGHHVNEIKEWLMIKGF